LLAEIETSAYHMHTIDLLYYLKMMFLKILRTQGVEGKQNSNFVAIPIWH